MTKEQLNAAILDKLQAGLDPLDICQALNCSLAQVNVVAGKFGLNSNATAATGGNSKRRRGVDTKSYHITLRAGPRQQ
jgi:hypothetical protein